MVRKSLFLILALAGFASADTGFPSTIKVTETDNSPSCVAGQIKFGAGQVSCSGQTATVTITGGSGGSSSLEVISGVNRSSPTATIRLNENDFNSSVTGTTFYFALNPNATNYIRNGSAIQSGASFNVSSGTLNTHLILNSTSSAQSLFLYHTPLPRSGGVGPQSPSTRMIVTTVPDGTTTSGMQIYVSTSSKQVLEDSLSSVPSSLFALYPPTGSNQGSVQFGISTYSFMNFSNSGLSVSTVAFSTGVVTNSWTAGTYFGGGLATCGDSTHALSWGSGSFGCQAITASGGSGGSSLAVTTGTNTGFVGPPVSTPTAVIVFDNRTTAGQLTGNATYFFTLLPSSVTLQGQSVIKLQETLQTGATFYVSSGTVQGELNVGDGVHDGVLTIKRGAVWAQVVTSTTSTENTVGHLAVWQSSWTIGDGGAPSSGGSGSGIVSPGTFTWTNLYGASFSTVTVSTLTVTSSFTVTNVSTITLSAAANFTGDLYLDGAAGASGQVLTSQGVGVTPVWQTPSGGGGASSLAVANNTSVYTGPMISSPTAIINADTATMLVELTGSATAFLSLKSSSVTLQGNNLSATYLTNSSATATYLQISSATVTYLNVAQGLTQASAATTYLTQSSATATYPQISSLTATYLQLSSATATYLNKNNLVVISTRTIDIPFTAMGAYGDLAGCTTCFASLESTGSITNVGVVAAFDDTSSAVNGECRTGVFSVASNLATAGDVTITVYGRSKTAAASKNTSWTLKHQPLTNGEAENSGFLISNSGLNAVSGTQGVKDSLSWTMSISSSTWVANDRVKYAICRSSATNNLSGDYYAELMRIQYPTQ